MRTRRIIPLAISQTRQLMTQNIQKSRIAAKKTVDAELGANISALASVKLEGYGTTGGVAFTNRKSRNSRVSRPLPTHSSFLSI